MSFFESTQYGVNGLKAYKRCYFSLVFFFLNSVVVFFYKKVKYQRVSYPVIELTILCLCCNSVVVKCFRVASIYRQAYRIYE